jgi:hypothetical protein
MGESFSNPFSAALCLWVLSFSHRIRKIPKSRRRKLRGRSATALVTTSRRWLSFSDFRVLLPVGLYLCCFGENASAHFNSREKQHSKSGIMEHAMSMAEDDFITQNLPSALNATIDQSATLLPNLNWKIPFHVFSFVSSFRHRYRRMNIFTLMQSVEV